LGSCDGLLKKNAVSEGARCPCKTLHRPNHKNMRLAGGPPGLLRGGQASPARHFSRRPEIEVPKPPDRPAAVFQEMRRGFETGGSLAGARICDQEAITGSDR